MRMLYDADLKATVTYDDNGRVRGIKHLDEYPEMEGLRGRAAAAAYVREIAGNLKLPRGAVRNLDQAVSYLDPRQQAIEYRFGEEKTSFGLTTYVYHQTYLNTPVWTAGVTVTLKQAPALVVGATDTSERRINAELPSADALERYRYLFATGEKAHAPSPRRHARRSEQAEPARSGLLSKIIGRAAKGHDSAAVHPQLISGRFFVYRYDAAGRTEEEETRLPLSPVPHTIGDGSWRLVAELVFRLPHDGVPMNWRILVDVETDAILCLRALSSCLVTAKVFPYDPITSTGVATNTPNQGNNVLNPLRKDEQLHNLNPPAGQPLSQSLEGRWAAVTNLHAPNVAPPTRPAGSNFDFDVRTNDFAAVSAYYHVDRFFRLVAELGFPLTGPNGYFAGTQFPVEVDHRAFRAPWADGNVVNATLLGQGDGIESVYFALADFSAGGGVATITVTNGGHGYTSPPTVSFVASQGSGATAIVKPQDIVDGVIKAVHVDQPGKGYQIGPLVQFTGGGGTGAFAIADIDVSDPVGIAADWRVALHELGGHGALWSHVGQSQFRFSHSAGDSFAMILNDYCSQWHEKGVPDRFLLLPFVPSVPVRRSDRGVAESSLATVKITNPGSGYLSVSFAGGGAAAAEVKPHDLVGGAVTKVTMTDHGAGYDAAPAVIFSGGGGTGAAATAELGPSGSVARVHLVKHGKGYKHPPRVSFTGGGVEQAKAGISVIHGVVTRVTITDPGGGYTHAPRVVIAGGGGTGAHATAKIDSSGSVTAVTVHDGGSGYKPLGALVVGGGVGATATATVAGGAVTKVTVTASGKGYKSAPAVNFVGEGTGASAQAHIDASGAVTDVTMMAGGSGYASPPTVILSGSGPPIAQIGVKPEDIVDGAVTKVTVGDPGTGYTSNPTIFFLGGGSGAAATAQLGTWGWGAGMDQGTDGKLGSGYFSEQILSTTMFRVYQAIGGDAENIHRREFAAHFMTFLMLQAIAQLHPNSNPRSPAEFLNALLTADAADWTPEGVFGGAYGKVLHWAFEKQNLHDGAPPSVDVYIDDGRAGEYQYEPVYWASPAIWNRRKPDGANGHQEPALGKTNYAYVKIKNRGTSVAKNVIVRGYCCKPSAGVLWPHDLHPLTTPQLSAGTLRPDNAQEKTVGPFAWTPAADGWGHDCLLMIVSADGDPSNVRKLTLGGVIEDWRLVPNDNNIGQRNVVLVPGGGGAQGLKAGLHRKGFWVGNPGRGSATIAAEVGLPPLLADRGWRIALRNLPAMGARLKAHERRLVTFDVQAGKPFSKADAEAAADRDVVVTVTANGAIIGGMTYRIDPALRMPFNKRASAS
jgi:hypothetical protein